MFKSGIGNLAKQFQKLQAQLAKVQEELAQKEVEASAGGGMVTVRVNGKQELLSLKIDPEVVDPGEVGMLEDLVAAAVNEAMSRAREMAAEQMGKITQGYSIPGLT